MLVGSGSAVGSAVARRDTRANGADEVYQRLRQDLLSGRLMAGQRLVESEIVEAPGAGRAAVRAALSRLAHEGLVDKEPNRGARVRMVSEDEAVEITQARAVLEALAARHAALNAGPEDIEAMRGLLAEMRDLLGQHDLLGYSECNGRLHQRILAASRHATAQRLIANLKAQMVRFQYRTILVRGRANESLAEHTAIVDAIVARDPDQADVAMRDHLAHVADTLVRTRDSAGVPGAVG